MRTITKREIAARLVQSSGFQRKRVFELLNDLAAIVAAEVGQGNRIEIRGFGVFEQRERKLPKQSGILTRKCPASFKDIRFSCSQSLRIWGE